MPLCADLLSEHVAADCDDVSQHLVEHGLIATLDHFSGNPRRLEPLRIDASDVEQSLLEPVAKIADLEKPIVRSASGKEDSADAKTPLAGWLFLAGAALVVALWIFGVTQGSGDDFSPRALLDRLRSVTNHPLAPLAALPGFIIGSLVVAPVTG